MRIIRGKYGRRRFDVPTNISARPTTDFARENIFNVLENLVDFEGLSALDLFAGTGAITFEFLSRECADVTAVEKSTTQYNFIRKVAQQLNVNNLTLIKGDAMKFIDSCTHKFDIIFADPPYEMPDFDLVAPKVLSSQMLKEDTIFILEHNKHHDYSSNPAFIEHRAYGSVNFSIFRRSINKSDEV